MENQHDRSPLVSTGIRWSLTYLVEGKTWRVGYPVCVVFGQLLQAYFLSRGTSGLICTWWTVSGTSEKEFGPQTLSLIQPQNPGFMPDLLLLPILVTGITAWPKPGWLSSSSHDTIVDSLSLCWGCFVSKWRDICMLRYVEWSGKELAHNVSWVPHGLHVQLMYGRVYEHKHTIEDIWI